MDINALFSGVIEGVVANVPSFTILASGLAVGLKKINFFPSTVKKTEEVLKQSFDVVKGELTTSFELAKTNLVSSFDSAKVEMVKSVDEMKKDVTANVNGSLDGMKKELETYKTDLVASTQQTNLLAQQNKVFMTMISSLVSKNPELIRDNVSSTINSTISDSLKELEKYPEILYKDMTVLENSLKQASIVIGQEKFDELLGKFGYERKEKKL